MATYDTYKDITYKCPKCGLMSKVLAEISMHKITCATMVRVPK